MNKENFENFITNPENNDWTLRVRVNRWSGIVGYNTDYEDIKCFDDLASLIKKYEGETLRIKLFCGNDQYGPIEEGRSNYAVYNGRLCQTPEYRYEIRNLIGFAQYFNERKWQAL